MIKTSNINRLKYRLGGNGLYWLSQIVRKTCKFQITHKERLLTVLNSEKPVIFTGWHGITMMVVPWVKSFHPNFSDFVVLMPDDSRGDVLEIFSNKLGVISHRMNLAGDTTLGMARQVVRLTRRVMGGKSLFINPDGPDGPAHQIKPGIIFIARKANAVIVPIGAYCRHAYIIPRWDRYTVPLPFSRIACHVGEPINNLPENPDSATRLITDSINRVTLQAAADYYELV